MADSSSWKLDNGKLTPNKNSINTISFNKMIGNAKTIKQYALSGKLSESDIEEANFANIETVEDYGLMQSFSSIPKQAVPLLSDDYGVGALFMGALIYQAFQKQMALMVQKQMALIQPILQKL